MLNLLNQKRSKNILVFMISIYFIFFKNVAISNNSNAKEDNNLTTYVSHALEQPNQPQLEVTITERNKQYLVNQKSDFFALKENNVPVVDLTDNSNQIDFLEDNLSKQLKQFNEQNQIPKNINEFVPEINLTKNIENIDEKHKIKDLNNNKQQQHLISVLQERIVFLESEVDQLKYKIDTLYQDSKERHIDLDERFLILRAELQKIQVQNTFKVKDKNIVNVDSNPPAIKSMPEINKKIHLVKMLIKDGKYQQSKNTLSEIEKKFPLTKEIIKIHPEVFEVYYWKSEIDILLNDLNGALEISKQMVFCFENHERMPELLYKLGYLLETTGDSKESHKVLKSIIEKYPHSSSANLAKKILRKERIHIN